MILSMETRLSHSTPDQKESTDNAVKYLIKLGVPPNKLVLGAAFYGRMWENVPDIREGLYQQGKFRTMVNYNTFKSVLSAEKGFKSSWDDTAKAPYSYNAVEKLFVTYDDKRSMDLKTKYVVDHHLNGIMFWELTNDTHSGGLLDTINGVKSTYKTKQK